MTCLLTRSDCWLEEVPNDEWLPGVVELDELPLVPYWPEVDPDSPELDPVWPCWPDWLPYWLDFPELEEPEPL